MRQYIDIIFRGYAEEHYGKEKAQEFTDEQIEEARCFAYEDLTELTKQYGKQDKNRVKDLFFGYLETLPEGDVLY